jgi:ribosomal protein L7/L12
MIPSEYRTSIVLNSIQFIRAVTEAYGSEEGMELWSRIAEVLDPTIKGEVFKAMLLGEYGTTVRLSGVTYGYDKISAIKAIRAVDSRRLGLKEAKDAVEDIVDRGGSFVVEIANSERHTAFAQLREAGFLM